MKNYAIMLLLCLGAAFQSQAQYGDVKLIAHRGGVVDDTTDENSLASVKKAAEQGFAMVELDVRTTKDGVLVVHHDRNLSRFFQVNDNVADLLWKDLRLLRSANGHQIQLLETMLQLCRSEGLQVMIDLKVQGHQQHQFEKIYALLVEHGLADQALIIPTEEATDYFRGKIKLSCTRAQIEAYQLRQDYSPAHYYLFANPSPDDFNWAKSNSIQVVGVINYRTNSEVDYKKTAKYLQQLGVKWVQLDSMFAHYFKK